MLLGGMHRVLTKQFQLRGLCSLTLEGKKLENEKETTNHWLMRLLSVALCAAELQFYQCSQNMLTETNLLLVSFLELKFCPLHMLQFLFLGSVNIQHTQE